MTNHRNDIDIIKAFAILAVIAYHAGFLSSGYLGVDAFFVVNGFLVIPSMIEKNTNWGGYFSSLAKRLIRLWPIIIFASAICMIVGYYGMLPDDYENLSQSIVASNLFVNNILSAITTKNYWAVVNDYKPLMHTWYLGVLVQFYILYPIIVFLINGLSNRFKKDSIRINLYALLLLTFFSLLAYLMPGVPESERFYYLPYRFYEMGIGGLLAIMIKHRYLRLNESKAMGTFVLLVLVGLLLSGWYLTTNEIELNSVSGTNRIAHYMLPKEIMLLMTVAITTICLLYNNDANKWIKSVVNNGVLLYIGKMTLSLFIWHQVVLAFMRCYIGVLDTAIEWSLFGGLTIVLSVLTYRVIEKRIKYSPRAMAITAICGIFTIIGSLRIYAIAGIVRDVPELGISKESGHRGLFAEYCDRVYKYDKDFAIVSDKPNVLVEGVSFGRDFANVILESEYLDSINLSYIFLFDEKYASRYHNCDVLIAFCKKEDIPSYVTKNLKATAKIYGIGPKNFGTNNSQFYLKRNQKDYFKQTVKIDEGFFVLNEEYKRSWKDSYIDMLSYATCNDSTVRIFSDENKYISQDCRHLTQFGAQWYAKILPLRNILLNK